MFSGQLHIHGRPNTTLYLSRQKKIWGKCILENYYVCSSKGPWCNGWVNAHKYIYWKRWLGVNAQQCPDNDTGKFVFPFWHTEKKTCDNIVRTSCIQKATKGDLGKEAR